MLIHCDLAYAGEGARFRLPFVNMGLTPEGASTYLLPQVAGSKRAAELLLLGEMFSADTALNCGFLNQVTYTGLARERAIEQARKLARLPKQPLRQSKQLLRKVMS